MTKAKHPRQPLIVDKEGTVRFKENAIVCTLLDEGLFNMNRIACMDFSREDREQFAQLIGYSASGFGDLSYASPDVVAETDAEAAKLLKRKPAKR